MGQRDKPEVLFSGSSCRPAIDTELPFKSDLYGCQFFRMLGTIEAIAQVDASCPSWHIWFAGTTVFGLHSFSQFGLRETAVGTALPLHTFGARMHTTTLTASAVEKLNRLAKRHRDETGQSLSQSLEAIAKQAGFLSWKQVTVLASQHTSTLMSAKHNWRMHWFHNSTTARQQRLASVEELCDYLGGIEPVLLRSHCNESKPGARCLCELDPFMTAKRANVRIDVGDKYDFWDYLYLGDEPFGAPDIVNVRINLGLGSHGHYIHEHLLQTSNGNDDRSDSLNPNNSAYISGMNNRSNQLNPNSSHFPQLKDK